MARVNKQAPRISVNKLAEYITRKGDRKRQILHDQKYPSDYKVVYYKEASEAVALAINSNLEDLSAVNRTIAVLEQLKPDKIGIKRRIQANIDALESFKEMLDDINLVGAAPELGAATPPKLIIYGVEISVRPEILLRSTGRSGPLVGALKIHFPRTHALDEDAAGYVSAVLQEWCKTHLHADGNVAGNLCSVIDVGSRKFHPGVRAIAARMRDIEAECQNIAARWPTI